jgi:glycerol-3-phosphate cytidylyltransferase
VTSPLDAVAPRPAPPAVIGYAPGVYDLFHVGHLNLLRRASLACDYLIAGVLSDETALEQKHKRPVVPEHERVAIVRACRHVDDVHIETTTDKLATWEQVRFDVIFKGTDWEGTPAGLALEAKLAPVGVRVVYLPYTRHTSSSLLRDAEGVDEGRPVRRT